MKKKLLLGKHNRTDSGKNHQWMLTFMNEYLSSSVFSRILKTYPHKINFN